MNKKLIAVPALLVAIGGGTLLAQTDLLGSAQGNPAITASEAKKLAFAEVKGDLVGFEFDGDDATPHYEMELLTETEKVEVKVDAETGKVKVTERESYVNNQTPASAPVATQTAKISEQQAIDIALAKAPGTITEVELDEDDGKYVYEIDIRNGRIEYEFEIDAITGAVLKFEEDVDNE